MVVRIARVEFFNRVDLFNAFSAKMQLDPQSLSSVSNPNCTTYRWGCFPPKLACQLLLHGAAPAWQFQRGRKVYGNEEKGRKVGKEGQQTALGKGTRKRQSHWSGLRPRLAKRKQHAWKPSGTFCKKEKPNGNEEGKEKHQEAQICKQGQEVATGQASHGLCQKGWRETAVVTGMPRNTDRHRPDRKPEKWLPVHRR